MGEPAPALATLPGGLTLSFAVAGDPDSPAVVLLPGLTDSWRSYERVFPYLPASVRAFAVSQRGHGNSDKPVAGYRVSDFAADLLQFIDRLDLQRAVIVGHSSHGLVAQRFAIDHPERTAGIVLAASFATLRGNANAEGFVASRIAPLIDPLDPGFVREFQAGTCTRPVPPAFLDAMVAEALKVPARVWREAFAGLLLEDHTAGLRRIAVPTLLVWGDRDPLIPRKRQDELAAGIPGAELCVYKGVGHSPHWEEPERFAADLASFVVRIGAGRH